MVSSLMPLVTRTGATPSWRKTGLSCARSRAISRAARRFGGSPEMRSVTSVLVAWAIACSSELGLALAVLDQAQLGTGDADESTELVEREPVLQPVVTDAVAES